MEWVLFVIIAFIGERGVVLETSTFYDKSACLQAGSVFITEFEKNISPHTRASYFCVPTKTNNES
jgi:hypothetical protein